MADVELESTITCPSCGHHRTMTMEVASCQILYICPSCDSMLRPKPGDCCVFCTYGSAPCPPIQRERPLHSVNREKEARLWP